MHTIIQTNSLSELEKWNLKKIIANSNDTAIDYRFNLMPISSLVKIRKASITPSEYPDLVFNYIGMENISKETGLIKNFSPKSGDQIKSRSKVFKSGDILYGRLRPSLNKCLLVPGYIPEGVCSTEIFVLSPNLEIVSPIFISFLLRSSIVLNEVKNLVAGAALPRVQIKDFLKILIPVPSMSKQLMMEAEMLEVQNVLEKYSKSLETYPDLISTRITDFMSGSEKFELVNRLKIRTPLYDNPLPGQKSEGLFA